MQNSIFEIQESAKNVELRYNGNCYVFSKTVGWTYLLELLRHPAQMYNARELACSDLEIPEQYRSLSRQKSTALEAMGLNYYEADSGIDLADKRCVQEVTRRLQQVINIEAELRVNNDLCALAEILEEKERLQDYLQKVLSKDGRIRKFMDAEQKATKAVNRAIRRCIDGIEAVDPELGKYFRRCVKSWKRVVYLPGCGE
jgi:hypothetical protein